ncbi:MAG: hypothetical protein QG566_372 [Patescibacteria group bacterium]|nr:hypothetical protein [Patescibacteria group bacterium]
MENETLPNSANNPSNKFSNNKKLMITIIFVVIVLAVAGYFLWKYKNKILGIPTPITKEEKIDILNRLNRDAPNDGSVKMTTEEKLKVLEEISTKKPAVAVKKTETTPEQQKAIFNSIE